MTNIYKEFDKKNQLPVVLTLIVTVIYLFFIVYFEVYHLFLNTHNIYYHLLLSFISGNMLFLFSLVFIGDMNIKVPLGFFYNLKIFPLFIKNNSYKTLKSIFYVSLEELFWRGYIQLRFFNRIDGVIIITSIFTILHYVQKKNFSKKDCIEFFSYFLIVSFVFYVFGNIYSVIILHLLRNIYIDFYRYCTDTKGFNEHSTLT